MEALVIGIMMDLVFFARFLYIKKHFYKTKGSIASEAEQKTAILFIY